MFPDNEVAGGGLDKTPRSPVESEGYQHSISKVGISRCISHVGLSNLNRTAAKCRDVSELSLKSGQSSSLMSLESEAAH